MAIKSSSYAMRWRRKYRLFRARRAGRDLRPIQNRCAAIKPEDILVICVVRNELVRLPYFMDHYRSMGVNHFIFVDNDSDDGTAEFLAEQPDVSLWHTKASYRKSNFGVDWVNCLARRFAHNHWILVVDPDEFLVYPFCDTRPLRALTDWLDKGERRSFSAMLLDMYPKGPIDEVTYQSGDNPFRILSWFDSGNYTISRNKVFRNLWIQGGPRARVFFHDAPKKAPALNKIPLLRWKRHYAFVSSTHMILPRGLNQTYDLGGGERVSGVLLHAKFLHTFSQKAEEELVRGEHYDGSAEYKAYAARIEEQTDLWCPHSERYENWQQLEILGLMSKGNWA